MEALERVLETISNYVGEFRFLLLFLEHIYFLLLDLDLYKNTLFRAIKLSFYKNERRKR